jgi:hypothetical protein
LAFTSMNYHPLLKKVNRVMELSVNSLFVLAGLAHIMTLAAACKGGTAL